jgi:uncharacterized membrane protein YeaQ/YmgE (transglycosylase-associated protein family)
MDVVAFVRDNPAIIITLFNGLIAGWLAGLLLGGGGLIRNLIVGIIGAVLGSSLVNMGLMTLPVNFDAFIPYGNQIAVSTVGAMIVVLLARFLAGR